MMSSVQLETCWAFKKLRNNKFYYKAASCWYFYYWVIYDARIHDYQIYVQEVFRTSILGCRSTSHTLHFLYLQYCWLQKRLSEDSPTDHQRKCEKHEHPSNKTCRSEYRYKRSQTFQRIKINSNCLLRHRYWHVAIREKRRTTLYVCSYLYALKLFTFDKHILCYIAVIRTHVFYPDGPGFKSWSVFCCFPRLLQIIAITIPSAWTPISYLLFSPTFDTVTFLLLPTWYTNFLFIHINYIKLNSSTCFERNPPIIRRSTT